MKKTDVLTFALYEYSTPCIIPPTLWRYCSVFFKEPPEQPRFPYAIEQSIICCELNTTISTKSQLSCVLGFISLVFYSYFYRYSPQRMQLSRGFEQLSFEHWSYTESVTRTAVQLIPSGSVEPPFPPVNLSIGKLNLVILRTSLALYMAHEKL